MDAKGLTPILLALLLSCLVFPAKCKGGGDAETWATGGLRRWPDDGEEDMLGSSKLNIVLCIKSRCNPDNRTCYCCQTIPSPNCWLSQKECWDSCPSRRQLHVGSLPPAPVPSSNIDEPHYRSINSRAVPDSTSPGDIL
ncbi:hypothetical protein HU200_040660 [Digitaria exilis]|uniref:Uncharacterized protein n=1 Tax=Digitaria exilis TaxID=1010633 RepID=A0A835BKK2_9POAL|nr:hypothetical protein HU200_040660 [Digitaria exilis]